MKSDWKKKWVKGNNPITNYLMQPYATNHCNDNWLAAKYLQLIISGLNVAIGHLQVAPWRAHGKKILIILVLRMQKKKHIPINSKLPRKMIELDQLEFKLSKNVMKSKPLSPLKMNHKIKTSQCGFHT
jgi:hypothetical protein